MVLSGLRRLFLPGVLVAHVLIDMVARQPFTHEGRSYVPGEFFQCQPIHAAALRYQHKAEFVKPGVEPKLAAITALTDELMDELVESAPRSAPEPVRVKRRYRRRDLQAEE